MKIDPSILKNEPKLELENSFKIKGKLNQHRLRQMNERNGYEHQSQPSISPSRVEKLLDDKKSHSIHSR